MKGPLPLAHLCAQHTLQFASCMHQRVGKLSLLSSLHCSFLAVWYTLFWDFLWFVGYAERQVCRSAVRCACKLIFPPRIYQYGEDSVGFPLLLCSMDTELKRADPNSYPFYLLQGFQELICRPNAKETNIALVLEHYPLAKHEARLTEVVQLDHCRHDLAVRLVLEHCRQLLCDGGVDPPLVLGPGSELLLGHLDLAHLGVLVHSCQDANAPSLSSPPMLLKRMNS